MPPQPKFMAKKKGVGKKGSNENKGSNRIYASEQQHEKKGSKKRGRTEFTQMNSNKGAKRSTAQIRFDPFFSHRLTGGKSAWTCFSGRVEEARARGNDEAHEEHVHQQGGIEHLVVGDLAVRSGRPVRQRAAAVNGG